jgi:hypothetical protein
MVATYLRGRLGNNMYQYAYIRSVAERLNVDFSIHECGQGDFNQIDDIFPHLEIKKNVGLYSERMEEWNYDFKESFYNLNDNTITYGFFQNHMYSNREDVKKWFKIDLDNKQNEELNELLELYNPNEYCFINFRGTDFLEVDAWITDKYFFKNAQTMTKRKKYLVITDDIENAKNTIKADSYIAPNYKIALKLMTLSKELIIPAWTSFGWWGAWLSNSDLIIAPDIDNISYNKNEVFKYI